MEVTGRARSFRPSVVGIVLGISIAVTPPAVAGNPAREGMRRLLREPILHFLVLGAALFAVYGALGRGRRPPAPSHQIESTIGFASALIDVGLPQQDIPLALFGFNVGVACGQLGFVALVFCFIALARRLGLHALLERAALRIAPYAIGSLAAFWLF